jgi:hypothetical protein
MIAGALIGSQATAVCTVILLPQCVRKRNENATPRAEQRGWAVACFALTVALAAQISGGQARVRSLEFRVTELGGAIALLAMLVAAAFALVHQRAGRYASSRPGVRAVTLAAGAVVVLAAGMSMIVSRPIGTRPGQAFPWLCLLAAALATAASLVIRERLLAGDSRGAHAGDGGPGGRAASARRAWAASREAWDDWDRPLSGHRASARRDQEDNEDASAGHGSGAEEDVRAGQDTLAAADGAPSRDPGADWDPPLSRDPGGDLDPPLSRDPGSDLEPLPSRDLAADLEPLPSRDPGADLEPLPSRDLAADLEPLPSRDLAADLDPLPSRQEAQAEAAQADPGPLVRQDRPAAAEPADLGTSMSKEPQVSDEDDEDASDWFRPARNKAPVDRYEEDIEAAASWEAPSYWFRPAVKSADDPGDDPAIPDVQPEAAEEPDLSRSPD